MSSEEARGTKEEEQQQQQQQQQASPTPQQQQGQDDSSNAAAASTTGDAAGMDALSGSGAQQQQQQQYQQYQQETRMGRLAGSDRPLTMRERARLQEIEMLEAELAQISESQPNARRLLELEIHRLRWGVTDMIDLLNNRKCKIRSKVLIPQDQYPGFNFVGKLLGQGGSSLKKLQEETNVKMSILGAGSMRNEQKEQDCLNTGEAKYQHLKQTLHLQIDCLAEPTEAYYRISHALAKVKEAMTPDPNELQQYYANQMQQFNVGPGGPQPPQHFPVMGAGGGRGGRGGHFGGMPIGAMGGPAGYGVGPMGGGGGGMRGGRGGGGRGRGGFVPAGPPSVPNGSGMHYGDNHHGGGYGKPGWSPVYRGGGTVGPRGAYQHQQQPPPPQPPQPGVRSGYVS